MLNVVVTGASRGLGLGIGRKLAADGYRVIAIARRTSDALEAAIDDLTRGQSGALHFRPADLSCLSTIPGLIRGLREEFGAIYGLVNNAGIGPSGLLATMPDAQIEQLVHLNVVSPISLTKYVIRSMMADGGGGRIVNIASIISSTGYSGLSAYGASKAALVGFTRSLAREVGPLGITVNAVAPGFVETDMTHGLAGEGRDRVVRRSALRRLAEVDDIGHSVEFLLSDKARSITGTVLTVDAGNTA